MLSTHACWFVKLHTKLQNSRPNALSPINICFVRLIDMFVETLSVWWRLCRIIYGVKRKWGLMMLKTLTYIYRISSFVVEKNDRIILCLKGSYYRIMISINFNSFSIDMYSMSNKRGGDYYGCSSLERKGLRERALTTLLSTLALNLTSKLNHVILNNYFWYFRSTWHCSKMNLRLRWLLKMMKCWPNK